MRFCIFPETNLYRLKSGKLGAGHIDVCRSEGGLSVFYIERFADD